MAERQRSCSEEESLAALQATEVGPRTARVMSWLFVAGLLSVPLLQAAVDISRRQLPQPLPLLRPLPTALASAAAGRLAAAWQALAPLYSPQALHAYEDDLQRHSLFKQTIQPRLQALLLTPGGFGSRDCVLGRHGWLFYQPGISYLAGPDFLDPHQLQARAHRRGDDPQTAPTHPDPRPAILQLQEDCLREGVHLVLVPVPDKAMIQPTHLTRRLNDDAPQPLPNNPGFPRLLEELRSRGIDVFDPAPEVILPGEERYLAHDTHWTPAYMEEVAERLADHLRSAVSLPRLSEPRVVLSLDKQVSHRGDLAAMLRLPCSQARFAAQAVIIHPLVDINTRHYWRTDPHADVLLLGDSFTNIYSDGEGDQGLGWGRYAGFAAQLSRCLKGRPIDVIARNGAGSSQVRAELARRPQPLQGKRVLIWQFAARELALGDWKPIPLRPSTSSPHEDSVGQPASEKLVVEATILAVSHSPAASIAPYKDCLTFSKIRIDRAVQGSCPQDVVIAAFWSLRDNQPQPALHYVPGDRFRLTLVPLAQAAGQLRSVRYVDDLNDYEHPTYFVESCTR